MELWTSKDRRTILDDAEDFADVPTGGRVKQWMMGMFLPFWPVLYAVLSLKLGRATFFGRGGSIDIAGPPAVALNAAYIAFGCFIHFHYFWGLDSNLYRFSGWGKVASMVVLIPCMLYAVWCELFGFGF